ncbi:hypothetical protein B296_00035807 [Ensete ventricosum]|uniref:Uncharacterized protein n=1 Tax=Ensete ventricosum TaxID=4639 RepID=A0A426YBJ8_ENSVE|nr:hypothetical protein B296_00035807 [Ensete ventricosum]
MVIGASSDRAVHSTRRGPTSTILYRVAPLCAFSGGCLSCGIILYGPKRHGHDLLPYTSLRCHVIIRVLFLMEGLEAWLGSFVDWVYDFVGWMGSPVVVPVGVGWLVVQRLVRTKPQNRKSHRVRLFTYGDRISLFF